MYKYKSARKHNLVLKNEKILKKIHGTIQMVCSNDECCNKVTLTKEESKRTLLCSKCHTGFLQKDEV